nr:DUF92 domain-containing protein [Paenibacillus caui]
MIGAAGAFIVAGAAYWRRSLSLSGMASAILMGTIYYRAGDLFWFGILLTFFITSTALSKWKAEGKQELEKSYAKTGRRDAGQVFANGGLGMLVCLGNFVLPSPLWVYAFVGIMATVTADTWATELGGLSRKPPRSVLTGKRVPRGTSGGVSLAGSAAALAGGLLIGAFAWLFLRISGHAPHSLSLPVQLLLGGAGGLAGAYADSIMGASVQRMYRCAVCGKVVEVSHHCGQPAARHRGLSWMSNDAVNLISSAAGGLVSLGLGSVFGS